MLWNTASTPWPHHPVVWVFLRLFTPTLTQPWHPQPFSVPPPTAQGSDARISLYTCRFLFCAPAVLCCPQSHSSEQVKRTMYTFSVWTDSFPRISSEAITINLNTYKLTHSFIDIHTFQTSAFSLPSFQRKYSRTQLLFLVTLTSASLPHIQLELWKIPGSHSLSEK